MKTQSCWRKTALRTLPDGRRIIDTPSGPFTACMGMVFAKHPDIGDVRILDMRAWGFLTGQGHCALRLSEEEAEKIQDDTMGWIVEAINEKRAREVEALQGPKCEVCGASFITGTKLRIHKELDHSPQS